MPHFQTHFFSMQEDDLKELQDLIEMGKSKRVQLPSYPKQPHCAPQRGPSWPSCRAEHWGSCDLWILNHHLPRLVYPDHIFCQQLTYYASTNPDFEPTMKITCIPRICKHLYPLDSRSSSIYVIHAACVPTYVHTIHRIHRIHRMHAYISLSTRNIQRLARCHFEAEKGDKDKETKPKRVGQPANHFWIWGFPQ